MTFTAVLIPAEAGGFIAYNPETGTPGQGDSVPEAAFGCVVPNYREVKTGTLAGLLRHAGVSAEEFIAAL